MRKYTEEYKQEALRLAEDIGVSEASAKLGIATKTLYGRRSAQRAGQKPISKESESEQIRRLEKENDELRRANEILKKAVGLISR